MTERVDIRLLGLPGPTEKEMFAEFAVACGGTVNPDGQSFSVELEVPPNVLPYRGSAGAFLEALEQALKEKGE